MKMPIILLLVAALLGSACQSNPSPESPARHAGGAAELPGIEDFTRDMQQQPGFLPMHWQTATGKLFLELPAADQEVLYYVALRAGLGSNDVGLDRGQLGARHLVRFRREGPKVLMVAPNLRWRHDAQGAGALEARRALGEAFAESVLWGFESVAREGERVLVDATAFLLRDAHDIAQKLPGNFRMEDSRSVLTRAQSHNFPKNTFIEALQTFSSNSPGGEVQSTAAVGSAVSLHIRHAFVALPELAESSYRPRAFHPRSGFGATRWVDMSRPIDEPTSVRVINRHALSEQDPIVYYIDSAAPPAVRQALLEGANYWAPVFAKAGFPGGFRAELMPSGMDPLDVRHNTVQWVNRSTRGWSYGDSIVDPRTGEILKGHVTLGALRCRQDVLLMQGLLEAYGTDGAKDERIVRVALDRIKQLSAHEIGHTLGLSHNFAASMDGRESVMDYPAPLVSLDAQGEIDVSRAYRDGCGAWDEAAIRYGYAAFAPEREAEELAGCIAAAREADLHYLSDADARGPGRSNPLANLWDNGSDALAALETTYRVRRKALDKLSAGALIGSQPLSELERVFVPVYMHHQYQIEAACRLIGGIEYEYAMNDEAHAASRPVPAQRQRQALASVLGSLTPAFLDFHPELAAQFLPPAPGFGRTRESFEPQQRDFDSLAPARAAIEHSLGFLLHPARAERLLQTRAQDAQALSLEELLDALLGSAFPHSLVPFSEREASLLFELQNLVLKHCLELVANPEADARVRAQVFERLYARAETLPLNPWHLWMLESYHSDPGAFQASLPAPRIPPGSPIGCGSEL